MKKFSGFNFKNKTVLLRCDFNVPISENGEVLDDFRIRKTIPTIKYLIKQNAKIVLMSHLEIRKKDLSLSCIVPKLNELLDKKVELLTDYLESDANERIKRMRAGEIVLLENLRFHKEEEENNQEFAKKISELADFFVNEAFSVSHRNHASIVSIPRYLPGTIGILFEKELAVLSKVSENPKRPFVVILGGVKVQTKVKTVINLLEKSDYMLLGSKIGEAILSEKGILSQRDFKKYGLVAKIDITNLKIHLPLDGFIGLKDSMNHLRIGTIGTLKKEEDIYDIGPETIKLFTRIIKKAKTILWNGPLGMCEDERFETGTKEILNAVVSNKSAFKVAGGGNTISVITKFGLIDGFDFLSTGGGAMLKFLTGEKLPGLEALN
ncbi:MAG: phosphoglycerate kinase [Candidatus Nealsonbacteria bacterium]